MQKTLLLLFCFLLFGHLTAQSVPLRVRVENIQQAGGRLWIGIYTSEEDFLEREKSRLEYFDIPAAGDTTLVIFGLEAGSRYALGIYYDLDGNDDLSTNWLGLPSEPWAMSQPLRSWLRKPRFGEMSFVFRPEEVKVMRLH